VNTRNVKRKLAALVSADVVGYSRLMGDDEMGTVFLVMESILTPM
jgi:class 3 adenylate cyclase